MIEGLMRKCLISSCSLRAGGEKFQIIFEPEPRRVAKGWGLPAVHPVNTARFLPFRDDVPTLSAHSELDLPVAVQPGVHIQSRAPDRDLSRRARDQRLLCVALFPGPGGKPARLRHYRS